MASRQAKHNKRKRTLLRTLGLCQYCGQRKPCGNAYCGRNAERRRVYQRDLMRERRAAGLA